MWKQSSRILAVGAAGKFARLVVPELANRGAKVRAFIQHLSGAVTARMNGATEVAIGDLRNRASLDAALADVQSVFYIAPAFQTDEIELGLGMVDAAKRAGVRRFVFSSVIHPSLSALVNHGAKALVEEAVLASDMEYAFLHPALFYQNFAEGWVTVVETGVLQEPWSTQTRFSRVDYRDVAEVAAIALTEERLNFGTFELCAEGNLNRHDVATLMTDVLGKQIKAATLNPAEVKNSAEDSADGAQSSAMKKMFDWYDAHGMVGNPLILRAILGREPRTLRAYIAELADSYGLNLGGDIHGDDHVPSMHARPYQQPVGKAADIQEASV